MSHNRVPVPVVESAGWSADAILPPLLAVAYLAAGFVVLPSDEQIRGIGLPVLCLLAAAAITTRLGRGRMSLNELIPATLIAVAVLALTTLPVNKESRDHTTAYGFAGVQVVMLLWVSRRWQSPVRTPDDHRTTLGEALGMGWAMAVGFSLIATIPILIMTVTDSPHSHSPGWIYVGYFVGGTLAALTYWLLQGIAHLAVGRFLIGILAGMCVYGAMAPVASALDGEAFNLHEALLFAYLAGGFGGPMVAFTL